MGDPRPVSAPRSRSPLLAGAASADLDENDEWVVGDISGLERD
jgi:hypothetical protein